MYGNKLMALHLHDNDGTDDQHRIPGKGTINWDSIVRKIRQTTYRGAVSLEVTNENSELYSNMSAQEFLKVANEKIKMLFQ